MKVTFQPQKKNEARLTVSWQHSHMKALLAGKIEIIEIQRSDKTITIMPDKFGLLTFEPKSNNAYFVANYSACLGE